MSSFALLVVTYHFAIEFICGLNSQQNPVLDLCLVCKTWTRADDWLDGAAGDVRIFGPSSDFTVDFSTSYL